MPRWLKVIRGIVGTGLTFAAGVGGLAAVVGSLLWFGGEVTGLELLQIGGKFTVVAFLLGVAFSGVLAVAARGRQFKALSLRLVGAVGAGAGVLYFAFLAMNGGRTWSPRDAIGNFVLLILMGAGAATATLVIARKAGSALESGKETPSLGAGDDAFVGSRSENAVRTQVAVEDYTAEDAGDAEDQRWHAARAVAGDEQHLRI